MALVSCIQLTHSNTACECVCVCVCVRVCVCVCVCVYVCVHAHAVYIQLINAFTVSSAIHIHTYVHTHTYLHTYILMYEWTRVQYLQYAKTIQMIHAVDPVLAGNVR